MSGLLLDEPVVAVQRGLVRALGSVTTAAVVQQIHWHAQAGHTKDDGWVPRTYAELGQEIGLTAEQVRRAVGKAEVLGALESCQPEGHIRRKWYRVTDMSKWQNRRLQVAESPVPNGGIAASSFTDPKDKTAEQAPPAVVKDKKPRARSERDAYFDALVLAFGPASTSSRSAFYGKAITELLAAGAKPEDVMRARVAMSRRGWNDPTPEAMLKHWDDLLTDAKPNAPHRTNWEAMAENDALVKGGA